MHFMCYGRGAVLTRHRLFLKASVLSAATISAVAVAPALAATIVVNNQAQFNAAIAVATQPGHADTINATTAGVIDSGTSLTVPGAATSINLQFGALGIGSTVGNGTMTLGPTATVSFGQPGNAGVLNMGEGFTGILNINGAAVTFNVSDADEQFNVGLDGGTGIVNMTSGSVTMNDLTALPGNFGSISVGYPFGAAAASGIFNQSGGTVSLSAGALNIGVGNGNGTYNLSNNAVLTLDGGTAYFGASSQGVGALNISGNATFDFESTSPGFNGQLFVGDDQGHGTITQNGVNSRVILNVINTAQFGSDASGLGNPGGTGTYNLLAGTLQIGGGGAGFGMAAGGIGFLNQSGGLLNASARIIIGNSGTGTYNMSGGIATLGAGLTIADLGGSIGTVNQTGGLVTISGSSLIVGTAGAATYNLNGGVLQVGGTNGILGTGGLNLGGGTLQVVNSALTANIPIALTGTNSTIDTNGLGATLGGMMSGTGGFVKSGLGTLSLTATDTYLGETSISAGTLQIGTGGTSGSIIGNVTDNATLAFDRSDTIVFGGTISGSGALIKSGAGVLTLTGADSYGGATAVNAGTLRAGAANVFATSSAFTIASGATLALNNFNNSIGSLAGSGAVTLGSATLTTGTDGTSTAYSGSISGTGGLTKIGPGVLSLSGTSGYSGPTNINAGILDVNGVLASAVSVNAGSTLMGSGTIGGLSVANGGTVAPGNSIGTMNVAGNVGFAAGSTYQVQVNAAGQSDLIAATGHATLTGGNVQVSGTPVANITYTILTAQTGVTGMFAGVSAPGFAFLNPELSYTPTSVLLDLLQTRSFSSDATTPNQAHVAAALASLPTGSALYQALLTQSSAAGARQAFNALSGEIHASTQAVMLDDSRYFRQEMLGRLRQAGLDGATGAMSALYAGGPQVAYAEPSPGFAARFDAAAAPLGYAEQLAADFPIQVAPVRTPAADTAWWARGVGAWGKNDGDGNAAGLSRDLAGFFTGVDHRFGNNWRAGVAGGYTNSSVSDSGRASSANIDTAQFGAYAGANYGAWNLRTGAAASWSTIGTNRQILFPGFSDNASARYGALTTQLFSEVGYGVALGTVAAEPFGGLAWVHLSTENFNETAGTMAALAGSSSQDDVGYSTLGARAATIYMLSNGMALTARASAAWQHAFGDVTPDAVLAFEGTASAFTVAGVPLARDAALLEAGLDVSITPRASIGVSYVGQLAQSLQDNSVRGNLLIKF